MDSPPIVVKATVRSYIGLTSVWWILGFGPLYVALTRHQDNLILLLSLSWGIAILWTLWLTGFRLTLNEKSIIYRDSFWRTNEMELSDIISAKECWIQYKNLGRTLSVSRCKIKLRGRKEPILLNSVVFDSKEYRRVMDIVNKAISLGG